MKVSIITMHAVSNYGSALQTYATQCLVESLGCNVEIIDYHRQVENIEDRINRVMSSRTLCRYAKLWKKNQLIEKFLRLLVSLYIRSDHNKIYKFVKKNIHLTQLKYFSNEELKLNPPQADVYMTGSDQVWNSIWNDGIDKAFFLDFAPADKKKIAFSASFGRVELDEDEFACTKELLKDYDYIGVRERSAVDLINKMGIDANLVCDPTLMHSNEFWRTFSRYKKRKKPYLLIYQLNNNDKMNKYAKLLAEKQGWELLRLSYTPSGKYMEGKCIVKPSVREFVGYIQNAACVITDSFHATAFSLNLGVDFICVTPPRFSTRLHSIMELTGTEKRMLKDYGDFDILDEKIDKEYVKMVLDKQRQLGTTFLKIAIFNNL